MFEDPGMPTVNMSPRPGTIVGLGFDRHRDCCGLAFEDGGDLSLARGDARQAAVVVDGRDVWGGRNSTSPQRRTLRRRCCSWRTTSVRRSSLQKSVSAVCEPRRTADFEVRDGRGCLDRGWTGWIGSVAAGRKPERHGEADGDRDSRTREWTSALAGRGVRTSTWRPQEVRRIPFAIGRWNWREMRPRLHKSLCYNPLAGWRGGGGGSRTRVREYGAAGLYMRSRSC